MGSKNVFTLIFILLSVDSVNTFAQNKFELKFSLYLQPGAYIDITGDFYPGYIYGGGMNLRTSDLLEIYAEFNVNSAKWKRANSVLSFNDYSLGTRFYIGENKSKVRPIIETGLGLYPEFSDIAEYNYNRPGIHFGGGASVNISKHFDIMPRARLHLAIASPFDDNPFYVYSGLYVSAKYAF